MWIFDLPNILAAVYTICFVLQIFTGSVPAAHNDIGYNHNFETKINGVLINATQPHLHYTYF